MNNKKTVIKTIKLDPIFERLTKLAKPKFRKKYPLPGEILKPTDLIILGVEAKNGNKWQPIPEHGIVLGWTVAYINQIDKSPFRYPVNKKKFDKCMIEYDKWKTNE
jgi:hypothetical protein